MPNAAKTFRPHWKPAGRQKDTRPPSSQRGYDKDWREIQQQALKRDKNKCVKCGVSLFKTVDGKVKFVGIVDHIKTIAEAPELRLVLSNTQSLCFHHNRLKTASDVKRGATRKESYGG